MKRPNYLTIPIAITGSYWILDHLLPDLLPKVPKNIGVPLAIACAVLMMAGFAAKGWENLIQKIPRPWFPSPFWRVAHWLRQRPSISIASANPCIGLDGDRVGACQFTVTLCRNLSRSPANAAFDFDRAELVLRQSVKGGVRTWLFRPVETGGFLNHDIKAKTFDFIVLSFTAMKLPMSVAEAPDFNADFEFEIRGVRAEVRLGNGLRGRLPPVRWQWFKVFNSGALPELQAIPAFSAIQ